MSNDKTLASPGAPAPEADGLPQIPDHKLLRCIGAGSYGKVWLARSVTGQHRAVKVIYRADFETSRPFDREFSGILKFEPISRSHDGLMDVLHVGRNDAAGYFYYVMELGDDRVRAQEIDPQTYTQKTLHSEKADRGRLPLDECLKLGLSLTAALAYLHDHKLVHRDIKPSNIIFVQGVPKLADIGLVAGVAEAKTYIGTEGYIPPEGPGTLQADLYSLGKVLYEASTGKDRLDFPELPTDLGEMADRGNFLRLNEVILKACENDPTKRYQTATQMHADLELLGKGLPLASVSVRPNNLPAQLTSFIGRVKELADVKKLLKTTRLLTLTGIGGCGKTRLALQVAADLLDEFADGVWLVELASLSDPALVPQVVAKTLDVREEPNRPLMSVLSDRLRSKHALLLLDNCEHLIEACAQLADDLLKVCPKVQVLATSREGLGIGGELIRQVPSLSTPASKPLPALEQLTEYEAVRLFIERAVALQPEFAVTSENAAAVAQICRRLDGIPLAIELAAPKVRMLTVEQIAERLDGSFRLLTGGSRTAVPRQQTLQATMDWSYGLLSEAEQKLLRRLSVFAGGFTMEAATAVYEVDALDLLTHLVDKSLVVAEHQEHVVRYRLLETIRQYGRDRLLESRESEVVRGRHRDFFLELAEQAEAELEGANWVAWLDRLEAEHDNLRAALEWSLTEAGNGEAALRLAGALWRFWENRGYNSEGRGWLEGAREKGGGASPSVRAKALYGLGELAWRWGDFALARSVLGESLAIQRELGDRVGIARSLGALGQEASVRGDLALARSIHEESLTIFRELGNKKDIGQSLCVLANTVGSQGDLTLARSLADESLTIFRGLGDKWGIAESLCWLGIATLHQGDYATARSSFEESLATSRNSGDKRLITGSLGMLGWVASVEGDYATARLTTEERLAISRQLGDKWAIVSSLHSLGSLALLRGDYATARSSFEESLATSRELGDKWHTAYSLIDLGDVAFKQEEYVKARSLFEESLTAMREFGQKWGIAASLSSLGSVAMKQRDYATARSLFEESLAMNRGMGSNHASFDSLIESANLALKAIPTAEACFATPDSLIESANLALKEGDYATAGSLAAESLVISREMGRKGAIAQSLGKLGEIAKSQGDYERAVALCKESLSLYREMGAKPEYAASLEKLAGAHGAHGQWERAAKLFGATEALREFVGTPIHPCDREDYDLNLSPVRAALSEEAFAAAWAQGRAMTMEQAVAYALEQVPAA